MVNSYRPETIQQVLQHLNEEHCHIFAGGTDLMIRKRQWQGAERKFTQPIVFINHLTELRGIVETDTCYEIGTLTTQTDIANSALPEYIRLPYSLMSHPAIRNIATVGGNIVNAASVADSLPILYALDTILVLESVDGVREVAIEDFILDKYKTLRNTNELLIKIKVPKGDFTGYFYRKLGQRKASILSKLSVFILHNNGADWRIAIGAINNTVIRDPASERTFNDNQNLTQLLEALSSQMQGTDDKRSTKQYREKTALEMVEAYIKGVMDV